MFESASPSGGHLLDRTGDGLCAVACRPRTGRRCHPSATPLYHRCMTREADQAGKYVSADQTAEPMLAVTREPPRLPTRLPESLRWLFWEVDFDELDFAASPRFTIGRVLERGGLAEVSWLIREIGYTGIHWFFRAGGHVEISPRTLAFWRCALDAKEETWPTPVDWKRRKSAPWRH